MSRVRRGLQSNSPCHPAKLDSLGRVPGPARLPLFFPLLALLLASALSIGVVFAINYTDQTFCSRSGVMSELKIRILAAVPVQDPDLPGAQTSSRAIIEERG